MLRKSLVILVSETSILGLITAASAHGGGCRKDSPKGQCYHAGSKPYHCNR